MDTVIPVRVALRIRPLSFKELEDGCEAVLDVVPGRPQISLRNMDKAFTYDFAYSTEVAQSNIYKESVQPLVDKLFKGFNATVLAYGQTGSGKTYSMGTANKESETPASEEGVIPRAVRDIFNRIDELKSNYDFIVRVSFIELYKENLYDLLSTKSKKKEDCAVDLREDPVKGVIITNLTEVVVDGLNSTMNQLEAGSFKRVTAATAMNNVSSRSHAIFTVYIEGTRKSDAMEVDEDGSDEGCPSNIVAKFHLVDLAGSERAKKTQATGIRYKEGVAINLGLLALGNVISALGDEHGQKIHIPYRDSKLTRLLQDSLGGNSHTLMIACVSPADSNFEETVSTLRYADRARKIKNKPIVNQDGKSAENAKLRREIAELKIQLLNAGGGHGGAVTTGSVLASKEYKELQARNVTLMQENRELTGALISNQEELGHMNEKVLLLEASNETMKTKMSSLQVQAEAMMKSEPLKADVENLLRNIRDVAESHKNTQKNLADHDASRFNNSSTSNSGSPGGANNDSMESNKDDDEVNAAIARKQSAYAVQLANLNKMLAHKEQMASAMIENDPKLKEMQAKYEEQLKTYESDLTKLQKEKDTLTQQHRNDPTSKIAEQRRKRIQELESSIGDLKKKVIEQQRVIKMNEKSEQKVKKLNEEIRSMKSAKVKLIKQMKEDAEKMRSYKQQKEREVIQLKQTERRQQVQMVKMETLHNKQQNVLRRKMEEAVARNQRLKEVLDKQKAAKKSIVGRHGLAGAAERMRNLVSQELDLVVSVKEAQQSKEQLLNDRKTLTKQMADLKKQSRQTMTNAERDEIGQSIKDLQEELDLRNAQIQDLQKQIVVVDTSTDGSGSGGKDGPDSNKWWDTLQTMTEAKIALQYLFEKATENMVAASSKESAIAELRQLYDEAVKNTNALEDEIGQMKVDHSGEMLKAGKEYEERVRMLLKHMITDGGVNANAGQVSTILDSDLQKFTKIHEELQRMSEECELQKRRNAEHKAKKTKEIEDKEKKTYRTTTVEELFGQDEDDDDDDIDNDPDWYAQTPLLRRIKKIRQTTLNPTKRKMPESLFASSNLDDDEIENSNVRKSLMPPVAKRSNSSSGLNGCKCKKEGCNNKRCPCVKNEKGCSETCKCDLGKCANRKDSTFNLDRDSSGGDMKLTSSVLSDKTNNSTSNTLNLLNDTYDVPEFK